MIIFTCCQLLFMPPTYIAGLGGMNVKVPLQEFPVVPPGYDPDDTDLPSYLYLYGYIPFVIYNGIGLFISFQIVILVKQHTFGF